jgi:hypothetical protein
MQTVIASEAWQSLYPLSTEILRSAQNDRTYNEIATGLRPSR